MHNSETIPRTERFLPDLVKEAEVIPVALDAGVRTPEVVAFDDSCSVVDMPYMVLARARGVDLARWLTGWFDRLSVLLPTDPPLVLVHGDIAPQNLL
ncbi:hypothetical protein ACFOY2_21870 [Nonomuraea purpurea]|uniref:Aminoglycoside phosphotransferase domain-containing protein n=1 Tax=Nonomuraea purpurea TaxID=1849276 RepID=A0ABV8GAV6_9ACTN